MRLHRGVVHLVGGRVGVTVCGVRERSGAAAARAAWAAGSGAASAAHRMCHLCTVCDGIAPCRPCTLTWARVGGFHAGLLSRSMSRARTPSTKSLLGSLITLRTMRFSMERQVARSGAALPRFSCSNVSFWLKGEPLQSFLFCGGGGGVEGGGF